MGIRIVAKAVEATLVGHWVEHSASEDQKVLIGRAPDCHMVLNDPSVELKHACLARKGEVWTIERLGAEAILLNSVVIQKNTKIPVTAGDDIKVGIFAMTFWELGKDKDKAGHSKGEPGPEIRWTSSIVVANGPARGKRVVLEKGTSMVLGRGHECDLILDDKRVSRRHARISNRGGCFWIEDLGSSNGVFVNSIRINGNRRIGAGDLIVIGRYRLSLSIHSKASENDGWAGALGMLRGGASLQTSIVGILCLALSLAACAAAFLV